MMMDVLSSLPPTPKKKRTGQHSVSFKDVVENDYDLLTDWDSHLDALLADLQNTISTGPPPPHPFSSHNNNNGSGGGVSGLSSPPTYSYHHHHGGSTPVNGGGSALRGGVGDYAVVNSASKLERSNSRCNDNKSSPSSPVYQNDASISSRYRRHPSPAPPIRRDTATPSPSFNNNLSELDNLLQDLSTSRYKETLPGAASSSYTMNGGGRSTASSPLKSAVNNNYNEGGGSNSSRSSPVFGANLHSNNSIATIAVRPSVDSLLDELNAPATLLTNGVGSPDGPYVVKKMTMEETTTTTTRTVRPPTAASSATSELDDLMASLSDFKVSSPNSTSYCKEEIDECLEESVSSGRATNVRQQNQVEHLDFMLGSLQAEMNRQGATTTQKGCCSACDKPIVGQVITALGKTWHPEHFTCTHCTQELGTRNFFERDGRPYCEPDYHNLFSPRCAYCNGPILDKCVTALEKTWHTEHFFCAQCGKQFGEEGFHEREGRPYCKQDYFNMFAPKCGACFRPIMENYVSALSSQWHSSCFVCRDCKKAISGKSFYAMEGKPVCPKCVGVEEE